MTNLFQDFLKFDTLLHTMSGFILAYIGLKIIKKLKKKEIISKKIITIFTICFSMTCAVLWEFVEFTNDFFFLTDMQKDRIIYNISSVKIRNTKKSVTIKNIDHTILYNSNNKDMVKIKGYLDIGLIDTIKDMFVNLIGALIFSITLHFKKE